MQYDQSTMSNKAKSGGSLKDYTALAKLHQRKGVSVFGYVQEVAYAFNTDHHGQGECMHARGISLRLGD